MALDFLAGCLGGCAGVLVGHPLDTIKVHLQTQDAKRPIYRGTFHCMKTIVARDSFSGLYRGISSPIGGIAFVNAIVFGVYGNVNRFAKDPNSLSSHFVAGATAGLAQSLVCAPMELAKTRLQLQENFKVPIRHKGPIQCLLHISRTEGIRGIFRGLTITALRDVPAFSVYFVSYEVMMRQINNPSALHTLVAGGLAGTFSWMITFPLDVVKSCLQIDGMSGKPKYSGMFDCIRQGYKSEGNAFFCRGLSSTLLRAFPMNAACFLVVSWIMKLSEKANLNVEIHPVDTLAMVSSSSTPIRHHWHRHDPKEIQRKKSHMIKSLVFMGAFSEAICASEIVEMANYHYDENHNDYYLFEENRQSSQSTDSSDSDQSFH